MSTESIIRQQKFIADKVLHAIEGFDPTCIVAGGAPRDWWLGREASDIDLFFHYREGGTAREVKTLLERAIGKSVSRLGTDRFSEEYKVNKDLKTVWEAEIEGMRVQFMEMSIPTWTVVDHFPLTICKAWYKHGCVQAYPEFKKSVEGMFIIKTNELYLDGSRYLNKIKGKFPDFKYYSNYEEFFQKF